MRVALFCERCERNLGSDQPAVASLRSSRSYGACLYNGDILHYPITCEASHRETRRLCVCRAPPRAGPRPAVEGDAGTTRVPSVVSKMLPGQAAQASEAETTSGWATGREERVSEAETTMAPDSSSSLAKELGTTIAPDTSSSSVSEAETTMAADLPSSLARSNESTRLRL
eukprot:g18738.t1